MTSDQTTNIERRLRETFAASEALSQSWADDMPSVDSLPSEFSVIDGHPSRTRRVARRAAPLAAAAVVAGTAIGIWFGVGHGGSSSHTPAALPSSHSPTIATSHTATGSPATSATRVEEPTWLTRCIQKSDPEAAEYIGLSLTAARQLAASRGDTLFGYAANGQCIGHLSIAVPRPVAIALTGANASLSNPDQMTVVYAARPDQAGN